MLRKLRKQHEKNIKVSYFNESSEIKL